MFIIKYNPIKIILKVMMNDFHLKLSFGLNKFLTFEQQHIVINIYCSSLMQGYLSLSTPNFRFKLISRSRKQKKNLF